MRAPFSLMTRGLAPAAPAALVALGEGVAFAHGAVEEYELFASLAEEPGFLRLSAAILGLLLALFGSFVIRQGRREKARLEAEGEAERNAGLKLIGPGAFITALGAAILIGGFLLLPDKLERPHGHSAAEKAAAAGRP
ncbi:MAG: hypothetical protein V3V62_14540 [bacterium]